jgi:hypothetical protein
MTTPANQMAVTIFALIATVLWVPICGCGNNHNSERTDQKETLNTESSVQKEKLPQQFVTDLTQFLVSSEDMNTMISFGIPKEELKRRTAEVSSRFEFLSPVWPKNFAPAAKADIASAIRGWTIAATVQTTGYIRPNDPLFTELQNYAASSPSQIRFNVTQYGMCFCILYSDSSENATKDYSFDSTSNLLTMASSYFDRGKGIIISNLSQR